MSNQSTESDKLKSSKDFSPWIPVAKEAIKGILGIFANKKNDNSEIIKQLQSQVEKTKNQIFETMQKSLIEKEELKEDFNKQIKEQQEHLNRLNNEYNEKLNEEINKRTLENEQHKKELIQHEQRYKEEIIKMNKEQLKNRLIEFKNLENVVAKSLQTLIEQVNDLNKDYQQLKQQYEDESSHLKKFEIEREDENVINVLLLGITGHGKSTFGNRLCGDSSKLGDQGPFGVSDEVNSKTKEPSKSISKYYYESRKISVIDSPGTFDSDNEDRYHMNNLIEYLRGIQGINAIIIVKSVGECRLDMSYQNMLLELQDYFGKQFWNHVILIITKIELYDPNKFNNWCIGFRQSIIQKFQLQNIKLPIIGINNYSNYDYVIDSLIKNQLSKLPRYSCNALDSPINNLKQQFIVAQKRLEVAKLNQIDTQNKLNGIHNDMKNTINALKQMNENVDESIYSIKNYHNNNNNNNHNDYNDDEIKNNDNEYSNQHNQNGDNESYNNNQYHRNQFNNNNNNNDNNNQSNQNHPMETPNDDCEDNNNNNNNSFQTMNPDFTINNNQQENSSGWNCAVCTLKNDDSRQSCEICSNERQF